jgi:L-aminopeptidase/D-esterase-like protein
MDIPELPPLHHDLTIPGITIGHGSDTRGMTGVTVILCPDGVTAAADVRGTATGTRQFDSLSHSHHLAMRAHAVVLAGGSGFGLASADAVVEHLEASGQGFDTGVAVVPLVPTAILFDLAFGDSRARPTQQLVESALAQATDGLVECGSVGAGTGATVGKCLGPPQGMKGGFGFASFTVEGGATVAAAVAVNAFGDVRDPKSGKTLAGCRQSPESVELVGAQSVMAALPPDLDHPGETNTTLAVVLTDADLGKAELSKVCDMAFGGLYRSVVPALSLYDGDLVVALATGKTPAHLHQIGTLAEEAIAQAIVRAVKEADGFGLLPAWRDLPG